HQTAEVLVTWMRSCADGVCGDDLAPIINDQLVVTILLGIVSFIFWFLLRRGFNRNVMVIAVPLVGLYLLLTGILILGGVWHLCQRPEIVTHWLDHVEYGQNEISLSVHDLQGWGRLALWTIWVLPALALGLSGFELSMILMPQVNGKPGE